LKTKPAKSLVQRDAAIIWHPYTQHQTTPAPLPIVKGEGVYLVDEKGNKYIDAISSWWTNIHGHANPHIAKKIYDQALQLEQVIFAGCTHEPAVQLAEKILPLLPGNFTKAFYSDNGSTAVEVALKMAVQYRKNKGDTKRKKILALEHSYHGDTFGAMSVSARGVFTIPFENYLFEVQFIHPEDDPATTIKEPENIACFIYEPLVQGAGGMKMYDSTSLDKLILFCNQHNIICIADEVMTGFGRTGKLFASEYGLQKPDIICLSKGLTGGALPLAITACTQTIFDAFLSNDLYKTFFHGHSYTANPLACAAALASLELLQQEDCKENLQYINKSNHDFVQQLKQDPKILNARSLGTILAFEFHSDSHEYLSKIKEDTIELSLKQGVFLRPLGNTVYIMPPYCITPVQLQKVYMALESIAGTL
jgi:adenosylmethionine---8-amino-7-oxononanoate aminotransferase